MRFGELLACDHRSRGAVHDPGGVAGGDEPVLFEVRLEAQQHLQRRLRPHVLVFAVLDRLPLLLDGHRNDLLLERAGIPRLLGALLRPERDLVYFLAGELVLLGEALGRLGHGQPALRVRERFPQKVLERRRGAESQTPPGTPHDVRSLAHRLRPAREHRVRFAEQDELCPLGNRLEPGPAQPVDRHGGHLDRQARLEPDVAGAVDRVRRRLECVADHHMANLTGRRSGALQRVPGRDGPELVGREVLERATERAEARPDAGQEDDVFIGTLSFHRGKAPLRFRKRNMDGAKVGR